LGFIFSVLNRILYGDYFFLKRLVSQQRGRKATLPDLSIYSNWLLQFSLILKNEQTEITGWEGRANARPS
jgi:hypothetical protein